MRGPLRRSVTPPIRTLAAAICIAALVALTHFPGVIHAAPQPPGATNLSPVARLIVGTVSGGPFVAPVWVQFDPSASHDPDGSIRLYEIDVDGDGVMDARDAYLHGTSHEFVHAGTYTALLQVTDDAGGMDQAMVTFTISGSAPAAGTLHPTAVALPAAGGPEGATSWSAEQIGLVDVDVYEYSYRNWNNANFAAWGSLTIGSNVAGLPATRRRIYLRFDPGRLGVTAEALAGARLELSHSPSGSEGAVDVGAYRVTEAWQEGQGTYHSGQTEPSAPSGWITWSHQPSFDGSTAWAEARVGHASGPSTVSWDLTELVRAWLRGTYPNHGVVLIGRGEGTARYKHTFVASEHQQAQLRPRLTVSTSSAAPGGQGGPVSSYPQSASPTPYGTPPPLPGGSTVPAPAPQPGPGPYTATASGEPLPGAGAGTLYGEISDLFTGSPLAGARITVGGRSTTTDEGGEYRLQGLAAGYLTVEAAMAGYRPANQRVDLVAGGRARLEFTLRPEMGREEPPGGAGPVAATPSHPDASGYPDTSGEPGTYPPAVPQPPSPPQGWNDEPQEPAGDEAWVTDVEIQMPDEVGASPPPAEPVVPGTPAHDDFHSIEPPTGSAPPAPPPTPAPTSTTDAADGRLLGGNDLPQGFRIEAAATRVEPSEASQRLRLGEHWIDVKVTPWGPAAERYFDWKHGMLWNGEYEKLPLAAGEVNLFAAAKKGCDKQLLMKAGGQLVEMSRSYAEGLTQASDPIRREDFVALARVYEARLGGAATSGPPGDLPTELTWGRVVWPVKLDGGTLSIRGSGQWAWGSQWRQVASGVFHYTGVGTSQGPVVAYTTNGRDWLVERLDFRTGAPQNRRSFDRPVSIERGGEFGAILRVGGDCYDHSWNQLRRVDCASGQYVAGNSATQSSGTQYSGTQTPDGGDTPGGSGTDPGGGNGGSANTPPQVGGPTPTVGSTGGPGATAVQDAGAFIGPNEDPFAVAEAQRLDALAPPRRPPRPRYDTGWGWIPGEIVVRQGQTQTLYWSTCTIYALDDIPYSYRMDQGDIGHCVGNEFFAEKPGFGYATGCITHTCYSIGGVQGTEPIPKCHHLALRVVPASPAVQPRPPWSEDPSVLLGGRVIRSSGGGGGAPQPDVDVILVRGGGEMARTTTDAQGWFGFRGADLGRLPTGTYEIHCYRRTASVETDLWHADPPEQVTLPLARPRTDLEIEVIAGKHGLRVPAD